MISGWSESVSVSKWAGLGKKWTRSYADGEFELLVCMAGVWRKPIIPMSSKRDGSHTAVKQCEALMSWTDCSSRGAKAVGPVSEVMSSSRSALQSRVWVTCLAFLSRPRTDRPWLSSQEHTGQLETAYQIPAQMLVKPWGVTWAIRWTIPELPGVFWMSKMTEDEGKWHKLNFKLI